jgi:beta-galactosidase GanA
MEQDCAGIMRADGSPREVAYSVQKFGADMKNNTGFFAKAKAKKADIAIAFDFDSMLMSEIEDGCGELFKLDTAPTVLNYRYTHAGMYRLFKDAGYNVNYVSVKKPEQFEDYKVLYFPYYTMLDSVIVPYLQAFLEKGGIVIADEGFGMRTMNTWMQPYDIDCKPLMTARLKERRAVAGEMVSYKGQQSKIAPFKSQYAVEDATSLMTFADGTPALQCVNCGKGKLYLFGCSIGYSYYQTKDDLWKTVLGDILATADVEKEEFSDYGNGVYERRLVSEDGEAIFVFNNSDEAKTMEMPCKIAYAGGFGACEGNTLTVSAGSMAYVIVKK